jgi:hypothetical protein
MICCIGELTIDFHKIAALILCAHPWCRVLAYKMHLQIFDEDSVSGSFVSTACHVLRLWMEETDSRYGG